MLKLILELKICQVKVPNRVPPREYAWRVRSAVHWAPRRSSALLRYGYADNLDSGTSVGPLDKGSLGRPLPW